MQEIFPANSINLLEQLEHLSQEFFFCCFNICRIVSKHSPFLGFNWPVCVVVHPEKKSPVVEPWAVLTYNKGRGCSVLFFSWFALITRPNASWDGAHLKLNPSQTEGNKNHERTFISRVCLRHPLTDFSFPQQSADITACLNLCTLTQHTRNDCNVISKGGWDHHEYLL